MDDEARARFARTVIDELEIIASPLTVTVQDALDRGLSPVKIALELSEAAAVLRRALPVDAQPQPMPGDVVAILDPRHSWHGIFATVEHVRQWGFELASGIGESRAKARQLTVIGPSPAMTPDQQAARRAALRGVE